MNKPTISIIVAMYNIQDYIIQCLESCANQNGASSTDYEVIIVNDGATDRSPQLVEEYICDKPNFRMITRPNGGLSAARNTGIDNAIGEYVWFVDGDDAIAPNAINIISRIIEDTHCDAYLHNFRTFEQPCEFLSTSNFKGYSEVLSGKKIHDAFLHTMPMMAWLTIYRTSLLKEKKLRFREGILHEDLEFSIRAHHCAETIKFVKEPLYYYRVARNDSIMDKLRKENTRSLVSLIEIIKSFKAFFKDEDSAFSRKAVAACAVMFFMRRYDKGFVNNVTTQQLISENKLSLYKDLWRSRLWKRRALLLFIILMPSWIITKVFSVFNKRSNLM